MTRPDQMTASAAHTADSNCVTIDSLVFGTIEVPEASIITFDDGLRGFEAHKHFALLPAAREGAFWLQSLAHQDVAFLLVDPFVTGDGYEVDIEVGDRLALELSSPEEVLILAIVTIGNSPDATATANFRGPLVLNMATRRGRQIVTSNEAHDVKTPIDLLALPAL